MADSNKSGGSSGKVDQQEEIDMGVFLTMIGRGIRSVFDFIGQVIFSLFSLFFKFLIFVRLNLKKLFLAALIGAIAGSLYQYVLKDTVYESSMTVQPNFGSAVQLYKNIDFYQSLIDQEDLDRLSSSLNLNPDEAKSLSEIEVEPYSNESQIVLSYKEFMSDLDSATMNLIDYNAYSKAQPAESFKYHVIHVRSKDRSIFGKIEEPIINSIIANDYYGKVKSTSYENLLSRKKALENSMSELDSMRGLYKKVLLAESMRESSGTNIYMSEIGKSSKEIEVFDMYMDMSRLLSEVNQELTEQKEVINVVSSFNPIGMKVRGWYRNFALIGLVGGFSLMLISLLLLKLNSILKEKAAQS